MRKGPLIFLSVVFIFFLVLIAQNSVKGDVGYVGTETCKGCHEEKYKSYPNSIHGNNYVSGNPASRDGCESCHGPGAEHVNKGGGKGGIIQKAKQMAPNCQSCHQDSKELTFWAMSKHKTNGVYCADCHSGHVKGKKNLKVAEPQLCYSCHKDIRAQVARQSHHPINEGKVKCLDCHSPHGSFGKHMIRADTNNELCYKCHPDKRGPFMFEHPPVEENCLNCHRPHGSNHNNLVVKKTPQLCQSCHDWSRHPGTPYDAFTMFQGPAPSNRGFSRNCSLCHPQIHGSNGPASRGFRFLR